MSRMTLEQRRAEHAWKMAAEGISAHGREYVNDAKGLPALIMNSGLMQVMAFLNQKKERHACLGNHLRMWLHVRFGTPEDFRLFMEEMMQVDSFRYQQITSEAFAWLRWLRQLAAARMEKEDE